MLTMRPPFAIAKTLTKITPNAFTRFVSIAVVFAHSHSYTHSHTHSYAQEGLLHTQHTFWHSLPHSQTENRDDRHCRRMAVSVLCVCRQLRRARSITAQTKKKRVCGSNGSNSNGNIGHCIRGALAN